MVLLLKLDQKPIRNIRDALNIDLFGGIVDFFIEDRYYRLENVTFVKRGENIDINARKGIFHFR